VNIILEVYIKTAKIYLNFFLFFSSINIHHFDILNSIFDFFFLLKTNNKKKNVHYKLNSNIQKELDHNIQEIWRHTQILCLCDGM
jgi:hypothetical protein